MNSTIKCLLFGLLLILSLSGFSQKPWSLQQCINYAQEHNIQTKQAKLNSDLSKSVLQQSYAEFLPSINGSANQHYIYGRSIDPFTNAFIDNKTKSNSFSLNSSVTLFNGFQLQNTRRQSNFQYQASIKDVEKAQNDLALNVVAFYLQILYNEEALKTLETNRETTKAQLDRVKKLVEVGSLPLGNKYDMEAQLASEDLQVVNAGNTLALSYLDLTQAMDLDSARGFQIEHPEPGSFQYTIIEAQPSDIFAVAVQNQPEIRSADLKVSAAHAGLSIARGARSPRIALAGSYGTGYSDNRERVKGYSSPDSVLFGKLLGNDVYYTPKVGNPIYEKTPFNDQLKDNLNKFIGFSLDVPIFNGWQAKKNIDRAKINYQNVTLDQQLTRNRLRKTIEQAHADAIGALRKYSASSKNVNALTESFSYAENKYNVGVLNSVDFLLAKNSLAKAQSELLQAEYEYIFKSKILDFYLGKKISF